MKKFYLLILLSFLFNIVNAQNSKRNQVGEYVQGFIVTSSNDTLHGLVKIEDYEFSEVRVKFKAVKKSKNKNKKRRYKKRKIYTTKDLQGYAFRYSENNNSKQRVEKWVYYVRKKVDESPRPFASRIVFLELKETGSLNLYLYFVRSNTGAKLKRYFIIEKANTGITQKVTQENFDSIAAEFISDCSQLKNRVGRADFTYYNLDRIVYIYNRCIIEAEPTEY